MGKSYREKSANHADQVLGQAQERRSLAVLTLGAGYVPDYAKAVGDNPGGGIVVDVTADMDDPNTTPPTKANTLLTERFGVVAFHVVNDGITVGKLELWVDGGKDASGAAIGWLLVDTIAVAVSRQEYVRNVGQRAAYLRARDTGGAGDPAKLRATGVA